jgi:hypothetical protein
MLLGQWPIHRGPPAAAAAGGGGGGVGGGGGGGGGGGREHGIKPWLWSGLGLLNRPQDGKVLLILD